MAVPVWRQSGQAKKDRLAIFASVSKFAWGDWLVWRLIGSRSAD